jgi:integrase
VIQSQQRIGDVVFASRSGEMPIVGYRKMWLNIANLGDLLADITPHVLRQSRGRPRQNEPTIASLLGHKTPSIISRCVRSSRCCVAGRSQCCGRCYNEADGVGSVVRCGNLA